MFRNGKIQKEIVMKNRHLFIVSVLASACVTSAFAATPINVRHQPASLLNAFTSTLANQTQVNEVSRSVDFKKTTHVRLKQTYAGVPVWGGDVMMHIPKGGNTSAMGITSNKNASMNGIIYQDLNKDLGPMPSVDSDNVVNHVVTNYKKEHKASSIADSHASLMVYVDAKNKAHWAYLVDFVVNADHGLPAKPNFIVDAVTFDVYQQWDNIQTASDALGGGFGGNPKMGKQVYDGLSGNLAKLNINRDADKQICSLKNADVTVKDRRKRDAVSNYACANADPDHDNIWWSADFDTANGAFSPGNDALYAGRVIQDMYMKWYGVPALKDRDGNVMMLNMRVHENMENAYWDGSQMTFGDGGHTFYPLVSLGVGAHEISHGFTEQHSGLIYYGQSGGLNEAFSDMAAQAAEFYSTGNNSWQIGPEIFKGDGALRFMDQPSKDCYGKTPGNWCSIDKTSQYHDGLDVHYSSGIFNRIYYLVGSADGWNAKKAFDIMVQAQNYWTSGTSWNEAACGVLKATADWGYDQDTVKKAFDAVEVDYSKC